MLEDLAAAVLLVGLTAYAILGGADFGAGFWDLTAGGAERGARLRGLVKRSMGPVWEANHVWLIFVLVVMWTCFPKAFGPLMETLYVPLFLAAVGIIFRGAAFALRGEAATIGEARALGATFALSSLLVPFFLGCAVGAVASVVPRRKARRRCRFEPFSLAADGSLDSSLAASGCSVASPVLTPGSSSGDPAADAPVPSASGPDSSVSDPSVPAGGSPGPEPASARASSRTTVTIRATSRAGSR